MIGKERVHAGSETAYDRGESEIAEVCAVLVQRPEPLRQPVLKRTRTGYQHDDALRLQRRI